MLRSNTSNIVARYAMLREKERNMFGHFGRVRWSATSHRDAGGQRMRLGDVGNTDNASTVERRALAKALQELHNRLTPKLSLADLAKRLTEPIGKGGGGYPKAVTADVLSRNFNGKRVPSAELVEALYTLVNTGKPTDLAEFEQLCALRDAAEISRGSRRMALERRNGELMETVDQLKRELADTPRAAWPTENRELPTTPHLPVPPAEGDRQSKDFEGQVKRSAAQEYISLFVAGNHAAVLAGLRHIPDEHPAAWAAAFLAELREQGQADMADTLVNIYGRDRTPHEAVELAIELKAAGLTDDADALLHMIVR